MKPTKIDFQSAGTLDSWMKLYRENYREQFKNAKKTAGEENVVSRACFVCAARESDIAEEVQLRECPSCKKSKGRSFLHCSR